MCACSCALGSLAAPAWRLLLLSVMRCLGVTASLSPASCNRPALPCPAIHRTPLALAAGNGEEKAVRVLLALGACGATADNEGATPLHLACKPWKGQEGCIAALLDAEGVELAATDRLGQVGRFPVGRVSFDAGGWSWRPPTAWGRWDACVVG